MRAHIFDLDGTLLDSMGIWEEIDRKMLSSRGIPFPADYDEYVATITPLSPKETADYVIKHFGINEPPEKIISEWNETAAAAYASTLPLKPGAKDYLLHLKAKGEKMAIATSSPKELCYPALKNHGIFELFEAICLSEEVGCGKNKPDVFLLAARKLGASPQNCIIYEDSLTAIKTAKQTGATVYAIEEPCAENHREEIKKTADYIIKEWSELT